MSGNQNTVVEVSGYGFDPSYGYSLAQLLTIKPPREPKNFDQFWQRRYQKALTVSPDPEIKACNLLHAGWRVFNLSYTSTGHFPIRGWLLLPESGVIRRGFIVGHGYGGRDAPDFNLPFSDAAIFFPCFRGLSLSRRTPISTEPNWHVLHGIDQVGRYILGGCVEDIWLAVSALLKLYPQTAGNIGYLGISFAGGVGALALSVEKRIARGHLNVPSFGHHPLRLRMQTLGSAHSVQQYYKMHKKQTLKVLQFYDAAIAARRISIPMHCACALFDPCVAPPGQFAIYNAIQGEKQLFVLDAGHHDYAAHNQQETELLQELEVFFKPIGD